MSSEMTAAIERLRQSRQAEHDDARTRAFNLGRQWAMQHAGYSELMRSSQLNLGEAFDNQFTPILPSTLIASAILGIDPPSWKDANQFWKTVDPEITEKHLADQEFLSGFVRGARLVWRQVANKL
jgi:hypothetical protein